MIQYSGGTYINRTFTPATKADWVNNVTQALSDAGWTTISGTPGSGSDVVMQTAANNVGAKIRVRVLDPGGANICARVTLRHPTGATAESSIIYCNPTGGTGVWRLLANKFTFYVFFTSSAQRQGQRGWVAAGTIYTPTFLNVASGDGVGFLVGAGPTDGDANARIFWRNSLTIDSSFGQPGAAIWVSSLVNNGGTLIGSVTIPTWQTKRSVGADVGFQWEDNSYLTYEPLVAWHPTTDGTAGRIKGQLYDAVIFDGQWTGETVVQFDGHTWMIITDVATANQNNLATLAVAIS